MNIKFIGLLSGFALLFAAFPADASILWNWSFDGESGTFLTDGTANGTLAAPGSYTLEDFSVTYSTTGQYLGSMSDGRYSTISLLLPVGALNRPGFAGGCRRQWKSVCTTNAIERPHEEFKRRIKTQTVLPSADTFFWASLASGQIHMVDGW